jgi:adenylyltransferase/sulfurtransferase
MKFREMKLRRDPECPVCGDNPTVKALIDYVEFCGVPHAEGPAEAVVVASDIDPVEVKAKQDRGDKFTLLDVREPHEFQICRIPGSILIPLGELPKRYAELDKNGELVVHCKMGGRSAKAVDFLKQNGFKQARNMTGGILAWSDKVDPRVPKY